jgi:hypothetical protein
MGLVPRKVALCVVMLCATLVSGCLAQGEAPSAGAGAGADSVIKERGAVAQQYWAAAHAFQRASLGFKVRLEVAVGRFSTCSPGGGGSGSSGGQQYQIVAIWEPVGVPLAEQAGLLKQAVPVIEGAFNHAGWSQFQPSTSSGLDVVATRQGITLSLDADPANPAPLERDWTPAESYTVAGPCIQVNTLTATELGSVGEEYYGTAPTALPPIDIPTSGTS